MGRVAAMMALFPEPEAVQTADLLLYVYAIVAAHAPLVLPRTGIDPSQPIWRLGNGKVQAIVSWVAAADFTQAAIAASLQDIVWVETHVRAHQQVLDQVVAKGQTILPMRFCTIYRDQAAVQALLSARENALSAELLRLDQKQEWGVKLFVEMETLQKAIRNGQVALGRGQINDEIAVLRLRIARLPNGAAFLYKKKLESLVTTHADACAFAFADESHARLAHYTEAAVTNPLAQAYPDLYLNAAYLIALPNVVAFHRAVEALAEAYEAAGLRYEVSGPWPAYNFLTMNLDE